VVVASLVTAVVEGVSAVEDFVNEVGSRSSVVVVVVKPISEASRLHMYWPQPWKTHVLVRFHPQQDFSQCTLSCERSQ